MTAASLVHTSHYSDSHGTATWEGRGLLDRASFEAFVKTTVIGRVKDMDSGFESDLRALASTDMQTQHLEAFLQSVPAVDPWEIGEALAECLLEGEAGGQICWPWNCVRDRRTPRASLPGADLVGFLIDAGDVWFVFGEVKTSSDSTCPPAVMRGKGMAWQLEKEAFDHSIQRTLLQWLNARCSEEPYKTYYRKAAKRFVESLLTDFRLYGVLLRDTPHNCLDLESRGKHLGSTVQAPATATLIAWYLPVPIDDWPSLLDGGSA